MGAPWFKLWAFDLLSDAEIRLLEDAQLGQLVKLWAFNCKDGNIPSGLAIANRLLGLPSTNDLSWVMAFFELEADDPSRMFSARMRAEQAKYDSKCEKLRTSAAMGGKKKAANALANAKANGLAKPAETETETETERVSKDTPPEPPAPAPVPAAGPGPAPVPPRAAKKPAAPKPEKPPKVGGPNGHLPEALQLVFWEAVKAFPPEKRVNLTLAAKAFAGAVATGQVTGQELAGTMKRHRATFPDDRVQFMTQVHAWLDGAGFMAYLEAERRGDPIKAAPPSTGRGPHQRQLTDADMRFLEQMP